MAAFITVLFDGVAYGSLLFVISVGMSVTMGLMRFINLAHGAFAMFGGYAAYVLIRRTGMSMFTALPIVLIGFAVIGGVLERVLYRWVSRTPPLDQVFTLSFALGSGLAALGGVIGHDMLGLDPQFTFRYMVYFLVVVVVGGEGAIVGSAVAAAAVGVFDAVGKYYVPSLGAFLIYALMIALLLVFPHGLFRRGR